MSSSHTTPIRIPWSMGMVWEEAYGNGDPTKKSLPFLPQSWKWKISLNKRKRILEGPIFHFHDFGKGKQSSKLHFKQKSLWPMAYTPENQVSRCFGAFSASGRWFSRTSKNQGQHEKNVHPRTLTCHMSPKKWFSNHWFLGDMLVFRRVGLQIERIGCSFWLAVVGDALRKTPSESDENTM